MQEIELGLAQRLERIEHENAQLRKQGNRLRIGGAAVLGLLTVMLMGGLFSALSAGPRDVLEARKFVLRDAGGMVRGVWEVTDNGGARLVLRDRDARERVRLTLLPDGSPGLTLADRDGRSRTVMGLLPDQTATLVFADRAGKPRAVLGIPADGSSTLAFADRDGEIRINVGVDAAGKPAVTTFENAPAAVEEPLAPIDSGRPTSSPERDPRLSAPRATLRPSPVQESRLFPCYLLSLDLDRPPASPVMPHRDMQSRRERRVLMPRVSGAPWKGASMSFSLAARRAW
jgi:hypothetical protein